MSEKQQKNQYQYEMAFRNDGEVKPKPAIGKGLKRSRRDATLKAKPKTDLASA